MKVLSLPIFGPYYSIVLTRIRECSYFLKRSIKKNCLKKYTSQPVSKKYTQDLPTDLLQILTDQYYKLPTSLLSSEKKYIYSSYANDNLFFTQSDCWWSKTDKKNNLSDGYTCANTIRNRMSLILIQNLSRLYCWFCVIRRYERIIITK